MNHDAIYNRTIFDKQIGEPLDVSAGTKLEFSDERPQCNKPMVVRVQFVENGDPKVLVRRRSHDEQKVGQAISLNSLCFDGIEFDYL